MAYLGTDGNLSDVSSEDVDNVGRGQSGPVPAGWYRAALIEDEAQAKSWGTGLSVQFVILEGEYQNRRVFDYLCVRHATSATAEAIARAKLKALAVAAGVKDPDNLSETDPLYHRPVMMEVRRTPEDSQYAEEDGKRARPNAFLSTAAYRAEMGQASKSTQRQTRAPSRTASKPDPDDIPF